MFIVHVHVYVKPDHVEGFREATIQNASNSIKEPGIARFDVVQDLDDPTHFVLVEVYRTREDSARHKDTAHYARWRDRVMEMMAEPRRSYKFSNAFPEDRGWG
jgi:(4S)-4-hydroxy-5-phosphonooxypentane-2,3-dione isomerase